MYDYINYIEVDKTPSELYQEFLNDFVAFRKENNLTQMEISKILNTSRSAWTGYECKKFLISTLLIYEVAKKYNYSIDYLLGKTDFPIKLK